MNITEYKTYKGVYKKVLTIHKCLENNNDKLKQYFPKIEEKLEKLLFKTDSELLFRDMINSKTIDEIDYLTDYELDFIKNVYKERISKKEYEKYLKEVSITVEKNIKKIILSAYKRIKYEALRK